MKGRIAIVFFVLASLLPYGCSGLMQYPDFAFDNSLDTISVPDAVTLQEMGVRNMTAVMVVFNPFLIPEDSGAGGRWPMKTLLSDGKIVDGFIFGAYHSNRNAFGYYVYTGIIYAPLERAKKGKSLYFSRLGTHAFSLAGHRMDDYDSVKFGKSEKNQHEYLKEQGQPVVQIQDYLVSQLKMNNAQVLPGFQAYMEISLEDYKALLDASMHTFAKMPNGEIRATMLDLEDFRGPAVKSPELTKWSRFWNNLNFGIPFSPESAVYMTGKAILEGAIAAKKGKPKGYFLESSVSRSDFSGLMEYIVQDNVKMLERERKRGRAQIKELAIILRDKGVDPKKVLTALRELYGR